MSEEPPLPIHLPVPVRVAAVVVATIALSACAPSTERGTTPPASTPPTVSGVPQAAPGAAAPSVAIPAPAPSPPVVVPEGALYVCVTDAGAAVRQTVIELEPKIGALCSRHPEMGPCRYERDLCRRGGGRVFAAQGVEITMQTEAEYDKKVLRVRLQAN